MKDKWNKLLQSISLLNKSLLIISSSLVIGIIFFVFMLSNVFTQTYEIERFNNAKDTIRSPITIEDTKETEQRRREAIHSVKDRYYISTETTDERIGYIEELFDAIATIKSKPTKEEKNEKTLPDEVQDIQQILSSEIVAEVDEETLTILLKASENDRTVAKELLTTTLYNIFNDGIRTEDLNQAIERFNDRLRFSSLNKEIKTGLERVASFALIENSFFSVDKTQEAKRQAVNNVEPVMIRAGEVIVQEGQTITNEIYEKLELVGLLNNNRNFYPVIGLIVLVLLIISFIYQELVYLHNDVKLNFRSFIAIITISLLMVAMMKFISYYTTPTNPLYYLLPVPIGVMLLKLLFREQTAMKFAFVFSIIGSVIFNGQIPGSLNIEVAFYFLTSQLASIVMLHSIRDRSAILKVSIGLAIVNVSMVSLFFFLSYEKYEWSNLLLYGGYGLTAALIACVLTLGILPFLESVLGILSDSKLLTLASPNHPLLRKILVEAPGTYHHSVMVANLSEAACEKIGANGLLARVASYYHDLGKTKYPHYFIENQIGIQNPHKFIEPMQSAAIIMSHPYDGANMLTTYNMPKEIIDIAKQHHGTTLLKYFYYQAQETYKEVQEADYRYPGPKPQTKEAAVISICDSIEAAVRSIDAPSKDKINEMIENIIHVRLTDGQLNESSLTFNELEMIKVTISETLNGIYHSRIQYPDDKKIKEEL
ncbi:7TM-HD extracellular [Paraliobacillus sp. PM-2]|uniref:HD family phosphohydrolase n=1 Tax=Paraliobacillus sp. PM-2 TaxID=1462524 RepID=UPI00061BAD8B|nr:HDIG domain-containing metalloprotein [Paraliobacillus sp. PM-2]CQR46882.1 7TM-HD extracellular [Paraliobacillus sp. PM-2]